MNNSVPKRKPTARDVAALAGVSQPAVSRAFTPGASISEAKREKIMVAARALGYRPNIIARSLNQRRSNVVGVVLGHFENPFFAASLEMLASELSAAGIRILLFTAKTNTTVDRQVDELLSYQVSAVILMAVNLSSALVTECGAAGIPVILFNRTVADCDRAFAVTGDNHAGAIAIAEHFRKTGKRRIAYMAGYDDSSTSLSRETAFRDYLARHDMPPPRRAVGHYSRERAAEAARALFANPDDRPDAVFCANDLMAIATIETLRDEFGLEPGTDYVIAGFDNIAMADWPSFALTTYSQPIEAMVKQAVAFVIADEDIPDAQRQVVLQGELILRKSA
jgi:DNA-binding LacI/PurR family transcriptional regulator